MAKNSPTPAPVTPAEPAILVAVVTAVALAAATGAKYALGKLWHLATGRKPPANAADPALHTAEAVIWAAIAGAAAGLARMLVQRKANAYYVKSTQKPPSNTP